MNDPRSDPGLALLLSLLAVLAGCSGATGFDGTPTRSVTPVPVPTDATPASRATVPGLSPRGVENASLLAAAHARAFEDVPFTERTVTTVRDGEEVLGRQALVVRRGPEAFALSYALEEGPRSDARSFQVVAAEVWSDRRTTVQSVTDGDGSTRRARLSNVLYDDFVDPDARPYARTLERASLRRVGRRVVDGTARYVFAADDVLALPVFGLAGTIPTGNASLRAVVGADGAVYRVAVTYPAQYRGRSATVEHVFEYADVGTTTVPRPSWYDEAIENGTPTPGYRGEG
ncbi:hypothetical protein ACFQE8_15465 [Salinirubellus sp. GCM10025818]|uniref:hypothetical protein n=1 Tax=Salinirubellus TaxID=2162630 RepID=UPI0030D155C8